MLKEKYNDRPYILTFVAHKLFIYNIFKDVHYHFDLFAYFLLS